MISVRVSEIESLIIKVDELDNIHVRVNEVETVRINAFEYPAEIVLLNEKIDEAQSSVANKVDKITGKGLSTNDLTNELKNAYDGAVTHAGSSHAPADAQKNVQANWNQATNTADDYIKNKPAIPTRDSLGLATTDSPEFANTLLTGLASGVDIPVAEWTWLNGIQAIVTKSVKSLVASIIHYLYLNSGTITYATNRTAQTLTGVILLDRNYTQYNSLTLTGAIELSVGANPVVGGFAEGIIVGNGTNTPTLNGITLWPTSAAFDAAVNKINKFTVVKLGGGVYINYTQMN